MIRHISYLAVCLYRVEGLGCDWKTGFKFPVSGSLPSILVQCHQHHRIVSAIITIITNTIITVLTIIVSQVKMTIFTMQFLCRCFQQTDGHGVPKMGSNTLRRTRFICPRTGSGKMIGTLTQSSLLMKRYAESCE